jgi:hypothetical protein
MTTPLPMRISVANLIDQEGCFVTLKAESRDLSDVKIIGEVLDQPPRTFTIK